LGSEIEIETIYIKSLDEFLKHTGNTNKIHIVIGENCVECESFLYSIADCLIPSDKDLIDILYLSSDLDEELGEYIVDTLNVYIPFFISNQKIFFKMDVLELKDLFCREIEKKRLIKK
jgi:hypothetical protein